MKTRGKISSRIRLRAMALLALLATLTLAAARLQAQSMGACNGVSVTLPFTDVQGNPFFCAIAQAFFSGLTSGTTATTYSPTDPVPREQMAAFITRTLDQSLRRGSRRAALNQFWTPQNATALKTTPIGDGAELLQCDGTDLWVANRFGDSVTRVRASDGAVLQTFAATDARATLVARGNIYVLNGTQLLEIDPSQPPGMTNPTLVTAELVPPTAGSTAFNLAFDGARVWTTNSGGTGAGAIFIVSFNPVSVTTVTTVADSFGILFDGTNIWVTETGTDTLKRLDAAGNVTLNVPLPPVPGNPHHPVFDGANIWVPTSNGKVHVVRAVGGLAGTVLATLTGNGLLDPQTAAFDGERILVTNSDGDSVSLWKAADLTPLGSFSTGAGSDPRGVCSDGLNFWITLRGADRLARF